MNIHEHNSVFRLYQWPLQSQDLNLREHLGDVVEWDICNMTNLQQLCDADLSEELVVFMS